MHIFKSCNQLFTTPHPVPTIDQVLPQILFEGLNNANWDLHSLYMNPALVQTGHDPEPKQILFIPVLKAMRFSFVYCLSRLHPIPFQTLV